MNNENRYEELFPDSYFADRAFFDEDRKKSIKLEVAWLESLGVNIGSVVCDVGCSTGEFLEYSNWSGPKFGMEVNEFAIGEAKKRGIDFSKNITNSKQFFDVVIMRGVMQHLDQPFSYIDQAANSLKEGGFLSILQTPDIGGLYYRIFKSLPALELNNTYFLPDSDQMIRICARSNLKLVQQEKPYWGTPYAAPKKDFLMALARLGSGLKRFEGPFPGNMVNLLFRKEI